MSHARFVKLANYLMIPNGKGCWFSTSDMIFYSSKYKMNILVPKGSTNNLASIPRLLRSIYPANSTHRPAAALHDFLYSKQCGYNLTRQQCDEIFYEAMTVNNIDYFNLVNETIKPYRFPMNTLKKSSTLTPKFKAKVFYLAVDVFGTLYFQR